MIRHRHQHPATRGPRTQVLLALCAAGVVLFNFPLLMVWDSSATVFGLPVLPVALFAVWGVLILVLALVCERAPRRPSGVRMGGQETGQETGQEVLQKAGEIIVPASGPAGGEGDDSRA